MKSVTVEKAIASCMAVRAFMKDLFPKALILKSIG